ncbi:MAG TPA: chitobiase/beta-hexosaminidase C-terminal domain-containing protein [Cyclobacteriaceae bacterium]|nr:chitobiase/beta-hexosaminidase C-terminal domain-containing protein [Cyclobacteriaceae bacterium]
MQRANRYFLNFIFFCQALLLFLLFFEDRIALPPLLQVAGRLHPAILHLPIGLLLFSFVMLLARSEFKAKPYRRIMLMVLTLVSLTASVTALFGFFLSLHGDYNSDALFQHKFSGVMLSFLCYGILVLYDRSEIMGPVFYILNVLALGFMFVSGHSGGTITHGEDFVLAPLIGNKVAEATSTSVYETVVFPVLEKKCTSCHNESKAKGKLIMTSAAAFERGGENGKEWVVGKPEESRLIRNIHLPLKDDDHMPPDGKPQLTAREIRLLESWVRSGADFTKTFDDLSDADSFKIVALAMRAGPAGMAEISKYDFPAAPAGTIEKLNTPSRAVFPLYQGSPALQADFFLSNLFTSKSLEELQQVKEQLVVLNLSKMPVTDQELNLIGQLSELEKLNLNFSDVKGLGLNALMSLKKLQVLSLAGTDVDVKSVNDILRLPSLTEVYLWNTKVTETDKVALENQFPNLTIVTTQFKNDRILRLGKPGLVNEGVVKKDELVWLKHSMPGAKILFTIDGTDPDTVTANVYKEPLRLNATTKIKAIACKEGWFCSEMFEITCFLDGYKPEKTELLSETDSYYRGEGAKSLTDKEIGFIEVLNAPPWLGYKDRPFIAGFDFGKNPPEIKSIVLSYADIPGGTQFPPESVEVWAGSSPKELKLIKSLKPEMPTRPKGQQVEALHIPLSPSTFHYYKIIAKPVAKLPSWNGSKGKKGWLMVDEVLFN